MAFVRAANSWTLLAALTLIHDASGGWSCSNRPECSIEKSSSMGDVLVAAVAKDGIRVTEVHAGVAGKRPYLVARGTGGTHAVGRVGDTTLLCRHVRAGGEFRSQLVSARGPAQAATLTHTIFSVANGPGYVSISDSSLRRDTDGSERGVGFGTTLKIVHDELHAEESSGESLALHGVLLEERSKSGEDGVVTTKLELQRLGPGPSYRVHGIKAGLAVDTKLEVEGGFVAERLFTCMQARVANDASARPLVAHRWFSIRPEEVMTIRMSHLSGDPEGNLREDFGGMAVKLQVDPDGNQIAGSSPGNRSDTPIVMRSLLHEGRRCPAE